MNNILVNNAKQIVKTHKSQSHKGKLSAQIKAIAKVYGKQNLKRM